MLTNGSTSSGENIGEQQLATAVPDQEPDKDTNEENESSNSAPDEKANTFMGNKNKDQITCGICSFPEVFGFSGDGLKKHMVDAHGLSSSIEISNVPKDKEIII